MTAGTLGSVLELRRTAVVALAVVAALAAVRSPAALADGDPASDVLVYQPVFFPYSPAPHAQQRELNGLVKSANQQGYGIRVAVIQSPRDLGSVPVLFGKPSVYARFLSSETVQFSYGPDIPPRLPTRDRPWAAAALEIRAAFSLELPCLRRSS